MNKNQRERLYTILAKLESLLCDVRDSTIAQRLTAAQTELLQAQRIAEAGK